MLRLSRTWTLLCLLFGAVDLFGADATYQERWRPQFHFTPPINWMNDPNGMVYFNGEYHLFYQYNPFGDKWGHMSWGHAVSEDMFHWKHLPVALYEENDIMIFSGSAVVDWKNTSRFGKGGKPPLVAIYTGHYTKQPLQNQNLAYSNDQGRTWTKYSGNPVLDIGEKDFRDPKVFWHEPSQKWIMAVSWPVHRNVRFYGSPNLKNWTHLSDFGPAGSTNGIWECPDLFPVKTEGFGARQKWALIVNVGSGAPAGGSGCQYFIGNFDGKRFTPESGDASSNGGNWADWARDFYAAVSWSDIPKQDGRRLWLGWMSNWEYANDVPTAPWRSAMSIPRELSTRKIGDRWTLIQRPAKEIKKLGTQRSETRFANPTGTVDVSALNPAVSELFDLNCEFLTEPDARFNLKLRLGDSQDIVVGVDLRRGEVTVDRSRSGQNNFHAKYSGIARAPIRAVRGQVRLRLIADASSLEVFANDGESVLTTLMLPSPGKRQLQLEVAEGRVRSAQFTASKLRSVWDQRH